METFSVTRCTSGTSRNELLTWMPLGMSDGLFMFMVWAESHFFSRTSQRHNALPRPGQEPGSSDSEPSALTTGQSRGVGVPAVQLTTHVKSSTLYGRTVVHPNFSTWWVTTILYNYGATLCELRYKKALNRISSTCWCKCNSSLFNLKQHRDYKPIW